MIEIDVGVMFLVFIGLVLGDVVTTALTGGEW